MLQAAWSAGVINSWLFFYLNIDFSYIGPHFDLWNCEKFIIRSCLCVVGTGGSVSAVSYGQKSCNGARVYSVNDSAEL